MVAGKCGKNGSTWPPSERRRGLFRRLGQFSVRLANGGGGGSVASHLSEKSEKCVAGRRGSSGQQRGQINLKTEPTYLQSTLFAADGIVALMACASHSLTVGTAVQHVRLGGFSIFVRFDSFYVHECRRHGIDATERESALYELLLVALLFKC